MFGQLPGLVVSGVAGEAGARPSDHEGLFVFVEGEREAELGGQVQHALSSARAFRVVSKVGADFTALSEVCSA